MKKSRLFFAAVLAALTIGIATVPVRAADESTDISDAQADQIRQNCKQAQSTLQRLQTTDVATRVNRGRIYENLLNRLMAPLNARVSFNRYDASSLTTATAAISQKFSNFKSDYQSYADSLSNLLAINCEANPRGFYNLLVTTRSGREKVSNDIFALNDEIDNYTNAFMDLRNSIGGR